MLCGGPFEHAGYLLVHSQAWGPTELTREEGEEEEEEGGRRGEALIVWFVKHGHCSVFIPCVNMELAARSTALLYR